MFRRITRRIAAKLLGPLARASQLVLDAEARLALTPRLQEDMVVDMQRDAVRPRAAAHLLVYEGGRSDLAATVQGPLGGPVPLQPVSASAKAM